MGDCQQLQNRRTYEEKVDIIFGGMFSSDNGNYFYSHEKHKYFRCPDRRTAKK